VFEGDVSQRYVPTLLSRVFRLQREKRATDEIEEAPMLPQASGI
jgi:hypothetical protein